MGAHPLIWQPLPEIVARRGQRDDEVDDLIDLLIEHGSAAAGSKADITLVAETVALACLGDNHLWQDLGLPSRDALSLLIGRWFPALAARNADNMKWKKFFYRQLCLKEDILICKSPSCAGCPDVGLCFGPETASPVQLAEAKA